jgi:hypothetical protein
MRTEIGNKVRLLQALQVVDLLNPNNRIPILLSEIKKISRAHDQGREKEGISKGRRKIATKKKS